MCEKNNMSFMYTVIGPRLTVASQGKKTKVLVLLPQFRESASTAHGSYAKYSTLLEISREKERTKGLLAIVGLCGAPVAQIMCRSLVLLRFRKEWYRNGNSTETAH